MKNDQRVEFEREFGQGGRRKGVVSGLSVGLTAAIIGLVGLVGWLFYRQQQLVQSVDELSRQVNPIASASPLVVSLATGVATAEPTPSGSAGPTTQATVAPTTVPSDRASFPSQTHTVSLGETLFSIGQQYSISWPTIVEVNALTNPDDVKAGQTLVIPAKNQVDFNRTDQSVNKAQQLAESGQESWRLDPVEVAKRESGGVYGLSTSDQYELTTKDQVGDQAIVTTKKADQQYEISLTQPKVKGDKGIWVITVVRAK